MIPLITHTPRLLLVAASRALLTALRQKPRYFPVLLGAALPAHWPPATYGPDTQQRQLDALTAGGRNAAGWHGWFALRKADDAAPRTLVGVGSFQGPPDAAGTAELHFAVAEDWRGQGLGTELLAGLVQQAEATGQVRQLRAHPAPDNAAAQQVLRRNGFAELPAPDGRLCFGRNIESKPPAPAN